MVDGCFVVAGVLVVGIDFDGSLVLCSFVGLFDFQMRVVIGIGLERMSPGVVAENGDKYRQILLKSFDKRLLKTEFQKVCP